MPPPARGREAVLEVMELRIFIDVKDDVDYFRGVGTSFDVSRTKKGQEEKPAY